MKLKIINIVYLAICIIGIYLLVKLWLPSGYIVAGHDSGLAINALEFAKSRFNAWDVQGFGRDNSAHFGSLTIHLTDYFWSVISGITSAGNQLTLFYWIAVIFVAAYIFAVQLKGKLGTYFHFIFPFFVTFNFYILQSIFVIERAKYSLLVALLLFLTVYIKFWQKKLSVLLAGILSSLILFVFNCGSWLGLPLYGSFFVFVISQFTFEMAKTVVLRKFRSLFRLISYFIITAVGFVFLNAYSIFPYLTTFLKQDLFAITSSEVILQNKNWLEMISQATSFINIFRLQGIPDWYASPTSVNLAHSYADIYLSNPIYIIISFIFPILAISSFILVKTTMQRKLISFMGLSMLLAMFFMAGSHKPLGFIYEFIYDYLPGFSIFRSPFYKFGAAFFVCVSTLMAFTLSILIDRAISKMRERIKFWAGLTISVFLIVFWFGYHFVLFSSDRLFTWQKGYVTKLKVPQYVNSFSLWANSVNLNGSRILLVPPINETWQNDAYDWGYWSLTNLPSVVSNQSFVAGDGLTEGEKYWVNKLYTFLNDNKEKEAYDLSYRLGIDYLLLRNDVLSDSSWSASSSPKNYRNVLDNFVTVKKVQSFDQWLVYKFDRELTPKFQIVTSFVGIPEGHLYLAQELLSDQDSVYIGGEDFQYRQYLSKTAEIYSCQSCPLELKDALTSLPKVSILPNSPLYYFKLKRETSILEASVTDQSKIDSYLGFSVRRAAEIKTMLDLGLKERYSIEALKIMNKHLEELYKLYQSPVSSDRYLFWARRLLDNINVIERYFNDIVADSRFGKKDQYFKQEMLDVLWNIKELKSIFPIINDWKTLETNKVYYLRFPDDSNYQVFLDKNSLPKDLKGHFILPDNILFKTNGEEFPVSLEDDTQNYLNMKLPAGAKEGEISMKFLEPVNLFETQGLRIEESVSGKRSCIVGKINGYNSTKQYRFEIKVPQKGQSLRMFIKDVADSKKGKSDYLFGQDEKDVFQTFSYQPFSYLYYPSSGSKDSTIYLCSGDLNSPMIDDFKIYEIFSPNIISLKILSPKDAVKPNVVYEKINNTSYRVFVSEVEKPFVLVFNETFNPFWEIKGDVFEHFMINGYANAWLIDKKGSFDLVLEYRLQKYFYCGVAVSMISLIFLIILVVFLKRKNDENKQTN